ncbi:MAG: hypothetical protein U9O66_02280, partial [Patescibacteria group bacterium]|nr:hypothetical protein [Patescibacteria group bacterium]
TIALTNGFDNPATKKKITITIYVKAAISAFLKMLVSQALLISTFLFLPLMLMISCFNYSTIKLLSIKIILNLTLI